MQWKLLGWNTNDYFQTEKQMSSNEDTRNPEVSRFVLEYLNIQPGPVFGVLMICVPWSSEPESIFHALHVVKSLATGPITYVVNGSREAQLMVRCSNINDAEMLDSDRVMFKFDDKFIKCVKLESVRMMAAIEDSFYYANTQQFLRVHEGLDVHNYPRGYTSEMEDINHHTNPTLSASTMRSLGVQEGFVDRLLKVDIKYFTRPRDFLYALRVANLPNTVFAVDEDGTMYMNFQSTLGADMTSIHHFFVGGYKMIKFYKAVNVNKRHRAFDSSLKPIYFRRDRHDDWTAVPLG